MVKTSRRYLAREDDGRFFVNDTLHVDPVGPLGDVTAVDDGQGNLSVHPDWKYVEVTGVDVNGLPDPETERYDPASPTKRKKATMAQRRAYRRKVAEWQAMQEADAPDSNQRMWFQALATVAGVDMAAVRAEYIRLKKNAAAP